MKQRLVGILMMICSVCVYADNQLTGEVLRYFYPDAETYTMMPNQKAPLGTTVCSREVGHIFSVIKNLMVDEYRVQHQDLYRYTIADGRVISNEQIYYNGLFRTKEERNDILTLFALPDDDKPYKWVEYCKGEKYTCKAEYVYIQYSVSGLDKAVKITKTNTFVSEGKRQTEKEWSYWVFGEGRIATLGQWDNGDVVVSEMTTRCRKAKVEEITEEQYEILAKEQEYNEFVDQVMSKPSTIKGQLDKSTYNGMLNILDSLIINNIKLSPKYGSNSDYFSYDFVISVGKVEDKINISSSNLDFELDSTPLLNYVKNLLDQGRLKQEVLKDPVYGRDVKRPIAQSISYTFRKRNYAKTIRLKKGVWIEDEYEREIPEDVYPLIEYLANEELAKNKKAKMLDIDVTYYKSEVGFSIVSSYCQIHKRSLEDLNW